MVEHLGDDLDGLTRRAMLKYLGIGGALLGVGSLSLAACTSDTGTATKTTGGGSGSGAGSSAGGPQQIAVQTGVREVAFDPMDPHLSANGVTINLFWYVYEALFVGGIASPTTFVPQLAADQPTKVNDTTYKVKVRAGATFQDGSPVTAEDVAFSFQRIIGLGDKSFLQKYLLNFKKVDATGADEVTFTLNQPTPLFVQRAATVRIVSKAKVSGAKATDPIINYQPIGSGPYQVTSADPSSGAKMKRYAAYNGPFKSAVAADAINLNIITDANARLSALQSGAVDAITEPPRTAVDNLKSSGVSVQSPTGLSTHLFFVNAKSKPFNDPRVIQAAMYAMDKDAIAQVAYNGYANAADALIPAANNDYTKPSVSYTHDPAKAKQLLADAGYPNGLSFELQVGTEDAAMVAAGQLIQAQLKDAGMDVKIRQGDTGGLYTRVTNGAYQAMYAGTSPALLGSADAEFVYRWLYYGAFVEQYVYWATPQKKQVTQLLDQAVSAASPDQYKSLMAQVIDIVAQYGPVQPVVHPSPVYAWNPQKTAAITPAPVGDLIFARSV